jgi:hypothetical protein
LNGSWFVHVSNGGTADILVAEVQKSAGQHLLALLWRVQAQSLSV